MPRIVWPNQPECIAAAWHRHHGPLPAAVAGLLALTAPPPMEPGLAKAFLRCFYAARDLGRTERDVAAGGPETDAFAARTVAKRVEALRARMDALQALLRD